MSSSACRSNNVREAGSRERGGISAEGVAFTRARVASAGSDVPQMCVSSWVTSATETRRNLLCDLYCTSPPGGRRDHRSVGVRLFLGLLTSLVGGVDVVVGFQRVPAKTQVNHLSSGLLSYCQIAGIT